MKSHETITSDRSAPRLSEEERRHVQVVMDDMLQSPPFRTSRQCQDLLRHIVRHSLNGADELLRERIIGVEVFGRKPDYDQAADPVVRIRAAEVRKRLALYYSQPGISGTPVRLSVPSGSYKAVFERVDNPPPAAQNKDVSAAPPVMAAGASISTESSEATLPAERDATAGSSRWWRRSRAKLAWAASLALLLIAGLAYFEISRQNPMRRFWGPVLGDRHSTLIYIGGNRMYGFSPDYMERYRRKNHLNDDTTLNRDGIAHIDPDEKLTGQDILELANSFISVGDAAAASKIAAFLSVEGTPYQMRFDRDISIGDLRQQPVVLIGAYNNDWTMQLTESMRFTFVPGLRIQDRLNPSRFWSPTPQLTDDYAVVSRVLNSKTGQAVITAAGLGQAGTSAAGEFLTNPAAIASFIRTAPPGWEKKNLQLVLHTTVISGSPSPPVVVAMASW